MNMPELSFFDQAAISEIQSLIKRGYSLDEAAAYLKERIDRVKNCRSVLEEDSIYNLGLSTRNVNTLTRNGVTTINMLNELSDSDILRMNGNGPGQLRRIRLALKLHNEKLLPNDLELLDAHIRKVLRERRGVETLNELTNLSEEDILCTIGLSEQSLKIIKSFLRICQKELRTQ